MKKLSLIASVLAVLGLTACEKGPDELGEGMSPSPTGQVTNSVLQVRTRGTSPSEEATIAYPVQVYVMQGDMCKAMQTIGDEGQTLNIDLVEGTYSVYAIAGASATDYTLPTQSEGTSTSAITLKEGKVHGDLMAAQATATLIDGGTNTVTLGLQRKTMLLQDVTIKKVPKAATAVSVTIAPLWQSLTVGGTYSTDGGSQTIALTRQDDNRTWTLEGEAIHLLPPSTQPASVSVNITTGGATKTYTYSCSDQLEAAYKINIEGTYTEAVGVSLTGTITGSTWLGERTISFEFNESGSSASGDENSGNGGSGDGSFEIPGAGSTYQGCYVLAVTTIDANSAELTLLSPNESTVTSASNANAALATLGVDGISDWSIPNQAQMDLFYAAKGDVTPAPAGQRYLWQGDTSLRQRYMSDGSDSNANFNYAIFLRPVATVSITKD